MPGVKRLKNGDLSHEVDEGSGYLDDLPPGPLDEYRRQASFNWKDMRLTIENEKHLKLKVRTELV